MQGMDMGGDDSHGHGSGSDSAPMGGMLSVFQTNTATPLYSSAWAPSSAGAYAGTCIFLIALAALLRGLLALKAVQEQRWLDAELKRRYVVVAGKEGLGERLSKDSDARPIVVSENGVEENVMVVQRKRALVRPWRFSVDLPRACIDLVVAGVGYLL